MFDRVSNLEPEIQYLGAKQKRSHLRRRHNPSVAGPVDRYPVAVGIWPAYCARDCCYRVLRGVIFFGARGRAVLISIGAIPLVLGITVYLGIWFFVFPCAIFNWCSVLHNFFGVH
jgi:hypothetical protein